MEQAHKNKPAIKMRTKTNLENENKNEFITIVSVGSEKEVRENVQGNDSDADNQKSGFVTVLTIGDEAAPPAEIIEDVLVYRLPGERLGFGLKFEGGTKTTECVRRLFIQSCALDSPASRVKCSWGSLVEGDEVLKIDSNIVSNMTRLDCVRCLKDSNVVINLLIKHFNNASPSDHVTESIVLPAFHSDEESSVDHNFELKRGPPPIPPRKLSRRVMREKSFNSSSSNEMDGQKSAQAYLENLPKSAPRPRQFLEVPPKVPMRDRKLSDVSCGPPDAEVYLDLLSQESEYSMKTESESDDTGSTISTVIDRHNSIFLTSNPSSIASDSIPSTPTAVQKQMDLSKVVNPFEILEMEYAANNLQSNDDFLFTKFVSSQDATKDGDDGVHSDQRINDCDKVSLVPPANFQDAPLSYGNEEVISMGTRNSSNNELKDDEFEHKIVEEIRVPKPVPRKYYAKKKQEQEDTKVRSDIEDNGEDDDDDDACESFDFNLPRLVNFVPKVPRKPNDVHYSSNDLELESDIEDGYSNKLCLMKYNNDFNYMYNDGSEMIECNNNDCEKIISCSTWSLNKHLETIGETEEELDSLENSNDGYEANEQTELIETDSNAEPKNTLSNDIYDNDKCSQNNSTNDNEKSIVGETENTDISAKENFTMLHEPDSVINTEKEIPIIQLTHDDGDDTVQENKDEIKEINDAIEIANFIQSEQQHGITTSEYSSLSSLSSPPLSFSSRLPPDGQEFPPVCQESRLPLENSKTDVMASKPDTTVANKSQENCFTTPSWVKYSANSNNRNVNTTTNNLLWRKDRNSVGSVKEKIAMFSSTDTEPRLPPLNKFYKSSENILEEKPMLYDKKNQMSKSCYSVNTENNNSASNVDTTEMKNKDTDNFNLPKSCLNYSNFPTKSGMNLHNRSQSMTDMTSFDLSWNNANSDSRRTTLNTLIEQRRRGLSKLRGLVIPQAEVPVAEPVLDLPEIRIKEANVLPKPFSLPNRNNQQQSNAAEASTLPSYQRNYSTNLQSPSWDNNSISNLSTLPRYSPAFKRKCLHIYLNSSSSTASNHSNSSKSSDSALQSDYEMNGSSLNSVTDDKYSDVFRKTSVCSDNESYNSVEEPQKIDLPSIKSTDNITSPSNSEISFEYSFQSTNSTNSLEIQSDIGATDIKPSFCAKKASNVKTKSDSQRSEDDSDNDSAVSSSQSSYISRECSPLPSPLHDYINNVHVSTPDSRDAHNGARPKEFYSPTNTSLNGRVLKPQSVEAINRKNILASAKCRSGKDFKAGSPLIQRKLSVSEDQKSDTVLPKIVEKVSAEVDVTENVEIAPPPLPDECTIKPDVESEKINDSEKICEKSLDSVDHGKTSASSDSKLSLTSDIKLSPTSKVKSLTSQIMKNENKVQSPMPPVVLRKSIIPTLKSNPLEKLEKVIIAPLATGLRNDTKKRTSVTDIRKQFEKIESEQKVTPVQQKPKTLPKLFQNKTYNYSEDEASKFPSLPKNDLKSFSKVDKKPAMKIPTIPKEEIDTLLQELNDGTDESCGTFVQSSDIVIIHLQREVAGGSIGITLTGGTDYEAKEITVHKVLTGSCAHKDGKLKKGDRILSINGKNMNGLTHKDSVEILKDPKPEIVSLVVLPVKDKTTPVSSIAPKIRKASSEASISDESTISSTSTLSSKERTVIKVELCKDGTGLGFSLDGGKDSPKGDMPLVIKKIFTGGAAEKCGLLKAGDELIEVNKTEVLKMTRIEVWSMMKKLPDGKVTLTIRR